MAGNRLVFEEAMKKAHNYAWDARWGEAAREYEKALAEFPDHWMAYLNLGMAYAELGRQTDALTQYQKASKLAPDDPLPLEKVASIQERLGKREDAAVTYKELARLWEKARSPAQALSMWQKVVALDPEDAEGHQQLAESYVRQRQTDKATVEYLAAARIYQQKGNIEEAIECCDSALALNRFHTTARALRERLSLGRSLERVKGKTAAMDEEQTPLSTAVQKALARLADVIFEEQAQEPASRDLAAFEGAVTSEPFRSRPASEKLSTILGRAIDYQSRGVLDQAISSYRRALELGADYPEIRFNLGVLYYKAMGFDQAIHYLQESAEIPDYALASYFALGQCCRAQGDIEGALEHYLRLLRSLGPEASTSSQAEELSQLYESLAGSQGKIRDRERAIAFIDAMTSFLSGPGWEDRLFRVQEQLESLKSGDVISGLAEIVEVSGSGQVLENLQRSQQYLDQGFPMAAIEECYWILDIAPAYLPVHAQLAEIFIQQSKMEQAVAKYTAIANTYQIRGDTKQAIKVYERIVQLLPLDVTVRPKLISLLTSRGQIDRALEEYMAFAEAYYQLAQMDKALAKYEEALSLATRGSGERNWPVIIREKMADICIQRLDWSRACTIYQEIKRLAPANGAVRSTLVDLYYKAGQKRQAETELDELLSMFRREGRQGGALPVLRQLMEARPADTPLRRRIVRLLLEMGRKEEAIAELDSLGEQQLEQGLVQEAITTVRQIIALNPAHLAAYQQLLQQLEAQQSRGTGEI